MNYTYKYPRPVVTADVVVLRGDSFREILFIRRGIDPFRGKWALPGGHVEMIEDIPTAACRELREETGISVLIHELKLVGVFGVPGRDPRGRVITVAYKADLGMCDLSIHAGDDAAEVRWYPVDELPELAFDHSEIVRQAIGVAK